jgi:hypothetical protein
MSNTEDFMSNTEDFMSNTKFESQCGIIPMRGEEQRWERERERAEKRLND